jgi:hypothetical protein
VGFTCAVCGRFHEEEPRDIRMRYPEAVARLPADERRRAVVASDDFCTYVDRERGSRHFARGLLEIPIRDEPSYFGYGAWVELDEEQIARLAELWRDPWAAGEPPFRGRLANELAPYVGTEGLPARLRLRDVERLPLIELECAHELAVDAREGIDAAGVQRLAHVVLDAGPGR